MRDFELPSTPSTQPPPAAPPTPTAPTPSASATSGPPTSYSLPAPQRPAPPRPAPRRSSPARRVVGVLVACVVLAGGGFGIATLARFLEAKPTPTAAEPVESVDPYAIPTDGQWREFAEKHIERAMAARDDAIQNGDVEQYLDVIDPAAPELRRSMERVFNNIQRLGIGRWYEYHLGIDNLPSGSIDLDTFVWRSGARLSFCFGTRSCTPETVETSMMWRFRDGRMVLTDVEPVTSPAYDPRPWEVADLVVARGERTVVAASTTSGLSPEAYLARAEAAAAVADTFARWGPPPSRYVVFLADSAEFDAWFGIGDEPWRLGVYLTAGQISIDVPALEASTLPVQDLLTHEMTHAATVPQERRLTILDQHWLVEGVAEYATMVGRPLSQYHRLHDVAQSLFSDPANLDPKVAKSAEYGIAYLTLRYLADTFGEDLMLSFYFRVVHRGEFEPEAATIAFRRDWPTLQAEADAYIRSVV